MRFVISGTDSGGLFCSQLISTEDYQLECFGEDLVNEGLDPPHLPSGGCSDREGEVGLGSDINQSKHNELVDSEAVDDDDDDGDLEDGECDPGISKEELTSEVTRIYQLIKVLRRNILLNK